MITCQNGVAAGQPNPFEVAQSAMHWCLMSCVMVPSYMLMLKDALTGGNHISVVVVHHFDAQIVNCADLVVPGLVQASAVCAERGFMC